MRKITEERFCEVCGVSSKFKQVNFNNLAGKHSVLNTQDSLKTMENLKTLIQDVYLMIMKLD